MFSGFEYIYIFLFHSILQAIINHIICHHTIFHLIESWSPSTAQTISSLQQLTVETILFTQRHRAIKLAEINSRRLQSRPIFGTDLRDLLSSYHRSTEYTKERCGRQWEGFTKTVSVMAPTFPEACQCWEEKVSMFTVLVQKARPRGFLADSENEEVHACVNSYERMYVMK